MSQFYRKAMISPEGEVHEIPPSKNHADMVPHLTGKLKQGWLQVGLYEAELYAHTKKSNPTAFRALQNLAAKWASKFRIESVLFQEGSAHAALAFDTFLTSSLNELLRYARNPSKGVISRNLFSNETPFHTGSTMKSPLLKKNADVKLAWSNALKQEVMRMFGTTPEIKELAEGDGKALDAMLTLVEGCVPTGPKAKSMILWLFKQWVKEHMWVPDEDAGIIRVLMHDYLKLTTAGKLSADLGKTGTDVANLDKLKDAVAKAKEADQEFKEKPSKVNRADAEEEALPAWSLERSRITDNEAKFIQSTATIVASEGGWTIYKIPKNPSPDEAKAMQLLTNNKIHDTSWCVGRDADIGVKNYWAKGPFYALSKNGKSIYAISSEEGRGATIWNASDKVIWQTTSGKDTSVFTNLLKAAQAKGIDLDLSQISSLPADILPVLKLATEHDPDLAKFIPEEHMVQGNTTELKKAVHACPIRGLVADMSAGMGRERTMGLTQAIMREAVDLRLDMSEEYSEFNSDLLILYIETLAAAGQKLPQSLEDAIIEALEASV